MGKNWRSSIIKPSVDEIESVINRGQRDLEDWKVTGTFVPVIDTVADLSDKDFPGNFLRLRILPAFDFTPYKTFFFKVHALYLDRYNIGYKEPLHLPETIDPQAEKDVEIHKIRFELYKIGTPEAKEFAKGLWPSIRGYANSIIRKIMLIDDNGDGNKAMFSNVGPRIFRAPEKVMKLVYGGFKDPDITSGNPIDLFNGNDLKLHMERREYTDEKTGKKNKAPQYDKTSFHYTPSPAMPREEDLDQIVENLHDLTQQYKPVEKKVLDDAASKIWDLWKGKLGNPVVQGETLTKHEELEPVSKAPETHLSQRETSEPARETKASARTEDEVPQQQPKPVTSKYTQTVPTQQEMTAPSNALDDEDDEDDFIARKNAELRRNRSGE